jgi:argininosuccinate lyase
MKGLPLAYNKDMQEDKEMLFDAHDTLNACLTMFTAMLKTSSFKKERMYKSALNGYTNATDAADYLVNKGVPFRQAHEIIGKLVRYAINKNCSLDELSLDEYKNIYSGFENDIYDAIDVLNCVKKRKVTGGPNPDTVKAHMKNARQFLYSL